jgi:uncharacterized membrane protein
MNSTRRLEQRFLVAVAVLSLADIALLGLRILFTGTTRYSFIPWNLALAWISLSLGVSLVRSLRKNRWSSGRNVTLSLLWLAFLPNAWYVLTDFIHVFPNGEISQLYDIVLISLLVFVGFVLGFASLFLIHRELLRRFNQRKSYLLIEGAIFIASFAIYLGRDLRWNTWDVITNPGSVVLNVSDQFVDPLGHPRALNVTLLFFVILSLIYFAFWIVSQPTRPGR